MISTTFLLLAGIVVLAIIIHVYQRSKVKLPLCQDSLIPILGHGWQIIAHPFQLHRFLERNAEKHGKFYEIYLLTERIVVVSDPVVIKRCLQRRPNMFTRGRKLEPYVKEMGAFGLFSAEGDDWTASSSSTLTNYCNRRRHRRLTARAFNTSHVRKMYQMVTRIGERLLKRWDEMAVDSAEEIGPSAKRDPDGKMWTTDLSSFTLDVLTLTSFGYDLDCLSRDTELKGHLVNIMATMFRRLTSFAPIWRVPFLRTKKDDDFDKGFDYVKKIVYEIIETQQGKLGEEDNDDSCPESQKYDISGTLIGGLLSAVDSEEDEDDGKYHKLDESEVLGNMITFMVAGFDTTSLLCSWVMYLLAVNPHIQEELQGEVDALLQEHTAHGKFAFPRQEAVEKFEYGTYIFRETLRMKTGGSIILLTPTQEQLLDESNPATRVSRNDMCIMLTRYAGIHPEYQEDPDKFYPRRWSGEDALKMDTSAYFPFGGGPRICPGRNLAQMEFTVFVILLAANFNVVLNPGEDPRIDMDRDEMMEVTLGPKRIPVSLVRRQKR